MSLISAYRKQEQADLWIWGQSHLYSKFQNSQDDTHTHCAKKKKKVFIFSWVLCLNVCLCTSCMCPVCSEARRGYRISRNSNKSYRWLAAKWMLWTKPAPVWEYQVILTAEPSPLPTLPFRYVLPTWLSYIDQAGLELAALLLSLLQILGSQGYTTCWIQVLTFLFKTLNENSIFLQWFRN